MYSSGTISPPGGRTLQNLKEELKTEKKKLMERKNHTKGSFYRLHSSLQTICFHEK
jgi:hypothetical protein